ncbi:hypothetical protein OIU77_005571 [Salix suchowensis]|uniref:Uncharacterized protein n=1 Tax=Salix suchowensis TaxID=1278906 RepID=A0ABQ9ARH2_9ROSI|nr:hypothetical protein OIU77_005571 [Salix suchowensis]
MHVKFSERSSSNNHQHFVYSRRKLQGNSIDFLPAITNRCGEDSPFVVNSDDPSVAVTEHLIVSEDEIESDAVREPMIRPVVCNGAEYSHPLCFGRGHAPSMPNISGDECLSLISSDDPSAAVDKGVLRYQLSVLFKSSACNLVYRRRKLPGNPGIAENWRRLPLAIDFRLKMNLHFSNVIRINGLNYPWVYRLSFSAPFHLVLSSICNGDLEFVEPNMVAILEVDL